MLNLISVFVIYSLPGLVLGVLSLRFCREERSGKLAFLLLPIQGACGYTSSASWSLIGWVAGRESTLLDAAYVLMHALGWPVCVVVNIVLIVGLLTTALFVRGWEKIGGLFSPRRNRRVTKPASPPAAAPPPRNRRRNVREVRLARDIKSRIAELRDEFLKARVARDRAEAQMEVIRQRMIEIAGQLEEDLS